MANFKNVSELEKNFSQGCGINVSKDKVIVNVYNEDDTITTRIFSINQDGECFENSKEETKKQEVCDYCGSEGKCYKNCKCKNCSPKEPKKEKKKSLWK